MSSTLIAGDTANSDFIFGGSGAHVGINAVVVEADVTDDTVRPVDSPAEVMHASVAEITGATQDEKAWNMINKAAHPEAREWLTEEAQKEGLKV